MARTWLSVTVELLGGRGDELWPWPGRVLAVGPDHTFAQLAAAINDAFARWDRSHLSEFTLSDGRLVTDAETGEEPSGEEQVSWLDLAQTRVAGTVGPGEEFRFTFDLGDQWVHRCVVGQDAIDPWRSWGSSPPRPCRTGTGARSRTSTVVAGPMTTGPRAQPRDPRRPTPCWGTHGPAGPRRPRWTWVTCEPPSRRATRPPSSQRWPAATSTMRCSRWARASRWRWRRTERRLSRSPGPSSPGWRTAPPPAMTSWRRTSLPQCAARPRAVASCRWTSIALVRPGGGPFAGRRWGPRPADG